MFGKKVSGQTTQKLFMTPAVTSAVAPSARNFQEVQQVREDGARPLAATSSAHGLRTQRHTRLSLVVLMVDGS